MNVRPLEPDDYENILCKWWKDWRKPAPPRDVLPDDGTGGFIVYDEDIPVCAGFMYNTNSSMVWIEFIVSNINYTDREKRREALAMLDTTITSLARKLNKKYVYSLLKEDNRSLIDVSLNQGYIHNSIRFNEMIKKIWEQQQ